MVMQKAVPQVERITPSRPPLPKNTPYNMVPKQKFKNYEPIGVNTKKSHKKGTSSISDSLQNS